MKDKIVLILAQGFEEVEAVGVIDILRRCDIDLTVAGLDSTHITGAHSIRLEADCLLSDITAENVKMLILPGGLPGATNLRDSEAVIAMVQNVYAAQGYIAAICAAPIALARAGIIAGKTITAYPGFESELQAANLTDKMTQTDGRIITGKGPGATFAFARQIALTLGKQAEIQKTLTAMFVQ